MDRDDLLASLSGDELRRVLANIQEEAHRRRVAEYRRGERSGLSVAYILSRIYENMPGDLRSGIDILLAKMPDVDLASVVRRVQEGWKPRHWPPPTLTESERADLAENLKRGMRSP